MSKIKYLYYSLKVQNFTNTCVFMVNFFNKTHNPLPTSLLTTIVFCVPFIAVMFSSNIVQLSAKPTSWHSILMTGSMLNKKKIQQVCFLTEKKLDDTGAWREISARKSLHLLAVWCGMSKYVCGCCTKSANCFQSYTYI